MTPAEKAEWAAKGKAESPEIPGFAKFIKDANADLYTHHGLCGYWSMNELSGKQVPDYSGQGNHGTLGPTYPSDCPARIDSFRKNYGRALSFDGSNDYVTVADTESLRPSVEITVLAWINPSQINGAIVQKGVTADKGSYQLHYRRATEYSLQLFSRGPNGEVIGDMGAIKKVNLNEYAQVGFIWKSDGTQKLIINGAIDKTRSTYGLSSIPDTLKLAYPRWHGRFKGSIDEARIYNRALSAAEIKKHYELLRLDKKRQPLLVH